MRRLSFFILICWGFLLLAGGCSPENDPSKHKSEKFQYFVEIADSLNQDRAFLLRCLGLEQEGIAAFLLPDEKIRTDVVHYYTQDPEGNQVVASGIVSFPLNSSPKGIILGAHHTITSDREAPSRAMATTESLLALFGFIVVSPDYLGFGNTATLPHPYLDRKNSGQVSVDMLLAVREYMRHKTGTAIDLPLYVVGYSQGGYVALAFQKTAEEKYPEHIRIKQVFAGGGPYEPDLMFDLMVAEDFAASPAVIPLSLLGADYGAQLNLSYSRLLQEPLLSSYKEWFLSKKYTLSRLNQLIGTQQLSRFLHPDVLTEKKNSDFLKVKEVLRQNRLTEWKPKAPVILVHGTADRIVPAVNSEHAYQAFLSKGCDVQLFLIPGKNHREAAISFYMLVLKELAGSRAVENGS